MSNFINTKTLLGRGWDAAPGNVSIKSKLMQLQYILGTDSFLNKLDELNPATNKRIVDEEVYQKSYSRSGGNS